MSSEDDEIRTTPASLEAYVRMVEHHWSRDAKEEMAHLLLTGRISSDNFIQIHTNSNRLTNEKVPDVKVTRDLDSFLAVSKCLPFKLELSIRSIPHPQDSLIKVVHIFVATPKGAQTPLHQVANWGFSAFEPHCLVRIAFPNLEIENNTIRYQGMFYDHAIYPAARLVAPSRMAEWPSNHVVALQGGRNDKGHLVCRSNLIAAKDVRVFGEAILEACNTNPNLSWAKDAFFIHQVKGVKGAFSIDVDKAELNDDEEGWSRQANMDTFMESIDYDFSDDTFDQAFIDVGLEFSMEGHVLHWDQNAHRDVVDFVIENMEAASQLTKQGHKGYWCDYASLLTGTAGFRAIIPPCTNPNCWDATYVQAYCTDKHLSTSAEKGSVAKHVRVLDILLDSPAYKKTIGEILEQCNSAVNNKLSANARLEVRVPLKHGCEVLPYMNADTMKSCLLVYKSSTWWRFKASIVGICHELLTRQLTGVPKNRTDIRTLIMTAGLAYFINGTQNRPGTGRAEHQLLCALLPLTTDSSHVGIVNGRDRNPWVQRIGDDDEEVEVQHPVSNTGMLHMRKIRFKPIPRMSTMGDDAMIARTIPRYLYKNLFGFTHGEILVRFGPAQYKPPPIKRAYKRRGPLPLAVTRSINPAQKVTPQFSEAEMARFLASRRMSPMSENEDDEEERIGDQGSITLPELWETIWYSFHAQILGALHNPKSGVLLTFHNYIYEGQFEELEGMPNRPPPPNNAVIDMTKYFLCDELGGPKGFNRIQTRPASRRDWDRMGVYLFPAKDQQDPTPKSGSQPLIFFETSSYYKKLTYHAHWLRLMKDSSAYDARRIRRTIMEEFNKLRWVPWVNKSTVWDTKKDEAFEAVWYPRDFRRRSGETAPRICLNPIHAYLLTWDGVPLNAGTERRT